MIFLRLIILEAISMATGRFYQNGGTHDETFLSRAAIDWAM